MAQGISPSSGNHSKGVRYNRFVWLQRSVLLKKVHGGRNLEVDGHTSKRQCYCDLCGPQFIGKLYRHCSGFDLLRCKRCHLIWTDPLKADSKKPVSEGKKLSGDWADYVYRSNAEFQKKRFSRQLDMFLKNYETTLTLESLKILEVGSGLGFFLDICVDLGMNVEGCDTSARSVAFANREQKRCKHGTLDAHYQTGVFDAVFAFNVIEHVQHPKEFLLEAWRVIKRGGMLVLETPVVESLFHGLASLGYVLSTGRLEWFGLKPGGHMYKFSKKTFEVICKDIGFQVVYKKNIESPFEELIGKNRIMPPLGRYGFIYNFVLPIVWPIARMTGTGNRIFLIMKKM